MAAIKVRVKHVDFFIHSSFPAGGTIQENRRAGIGSKGTIEDVDLIWQSRFYLVRFENIDEPVPYAPSELELILWPSPS